MKLTTSDYKAILHHYGLNPVYTVHKQTRKRTLDVAKTKKRTREVLATKLCRCIKTIQKYRKRKQKPTTDEKAAIAICKNSIFKNRGMRQYRFSCKKNPKLLPLKRTNTYITKTQKRLRLK